MHFSTIFAPLVLAATAIAQDAAPSAAPPAPPAPGAPAPSGGAPAPGAPAPSGNVMVQVVKVGGENGETTFTPDDIKAEPGSMVQFQFWPKNHSVAQSSFDQPCMPISQAMPNVTNTLWSGFMPTDAGASMMATWTIMINDTKPIWLYCAQAKHCQGGMVAAINADAASPKTLDAYKSAASKATANIAPGGSSNGTATPSDSGSGSGGSGSSGSSGSGSGSSPSSPSSNSDVKTGAASSVTYTSSTIAIAALLSAFVSYAL